MRAFLSCYAITRLAVLVVVALLDCRCHIAKFIGPRRLLGAALLAALALGPRAFKLARGLGLALVGVGDAVLAADGLVVLLGAHHSRVGAGCGRNQRGGSGDHHEHEHCGAVWVGNAESKLFFVWHDR